MTGTLFCSCGGTGRTSALLVTASTHEGINPGDLVRSDAIAEINLDPRLAGRVTGMVTTAPCSCAARIVFPMDVGKWLWSADWRREPHGCDSMGQPAYVRRLAVYGLPIRGAQ